MRYLFLVLVLILCLLLVGCSTEASVKEPIVKENVVKSECPRGFVHDEVPRCGLYSDTDSNGVCDLSE